MKYCILLVFFFGKKHLLLLRLSAIKTLNTLARKYPNIRRSWFPVAFPYCWSEFWVKSNRITRIHRRTAQKRSQLVMLEAKLFLRRSQRYNWDNIILLRDFYCLLCLYPILRVFRHNFLSQAQEHYFHVIHEPRLSQQRHREILFECDFHRWHSYVVWYLVGQILQVCWLLFLHLRHL